jgi:chromosome segregation ATPase
MWPKVLMQLFELLPHVTRLIPVADKYFSLRTAAEKANEAALAAMAEDVRGDLGQVTKAHASLYRQLQEQSGQIADMSEEVRRTRTSIEQHDHRLEALNQKLASLGLWVKSGVSVIVILLAVAIWLLARAR